MTPEERASDLTCGVATSITAGPHRSIFDADPSLRDQVKANVAAAPPLPEEAIELVNRVFRPVDSRGPGATPVTRSSRPHRSAGQAS